MKLKSLVINGLLGSLIFTTTTALAGHDGVSLGGPRMPGYARNPLWVNIQPATSVSYNPAQIRHAYGIDQLAANGSGQKIAIVDAYGNTSIQADLNTFCTQFGLPTTTIQVLGTSTLNTGWALETALDVEWAHAIAPQASLILSVAASASTTDLLNAVNAAIKAGATVVSMSWGTPEFAGESVYDSYFQTPGVAFVASSGDGGELAGSPQVDWPAASPYVVSVGGTTLTLDANNNRTSETAWTSSGGGLSTSYTRPAWQNSWSAYATRGVPDVSYNGDPNTGVLVYDSVNGGWFVVGGTSAGAPQWAALLALANQSRSSGVKGNSDIYSVAGTAPAINPANFFDITSGNNGGDADDLSVTGYDLVTGLGSPQAASLVPALVALAPKTPDFSISLTPTSQSATPGATVSYTVTVASVSGDTETVNLTATVPAGASNISLSPASITGSSGTAVLTFTAPTTQGSYTITVTGTGATSQKVHTASASLVDGTPDFSLSANPTSNSVKHGSSATYTVKVTPSGGFTSTVALTATVSPSVSNGPTASFSPQQVTGGSGTSQLTAKTSGGTPKGSYTITTTGTSGTTKHTTTVTLTVN